MTFLDLRTIVFLSGAIGALMSVVLFFMHRSHGHAIPGIKAWAWGPLTIFISTLLLGTRDLAPDWVSLWLGNIALILGCMMMLAGTRHFYDETLPRWTWAALAVASAALFWWGPLHPDYNVRLVVVTVLMAALQAHHFHTVWRHDRFSFAARFVLVVLAGIVLLMVIRAVSVPWSPPGANLFTPTSLQSTYIGGYAFGLMTLTLGYVLLVSERLRQQLQHLISHDTLTGALSRHTLFERAREDLERAQRTGRPLTVLMLDLDHFKEVNDRHGHLAGDQVLRDFALRASSELRKIDRLGRFGGEEFVAILPETDVAQASLVAERIRASQTAQAHLPHCTVSIGLATEAHVDSHRPAQTQLESLIARADKALYQAKSTGRNRISVAPAPHEQHP